MSETGWMPGIFRQVRHWVGDTSHSFTHDYGVTYYAECGAPCLSAPELRRLWWPWAPCAICAAQQNPQWTWGTTALQPTVAHAYAANSLAVCGSLLTEPVVNISRRYDLAGCRYCLAELSGEVSE